MAKAESFTLLALAIVIIITRLWWRWTQVGFSGFDLDDYLMPVTALLFGTVTALAYMVGAQYDGLTNSYMTDEERAMLDPDSREAFNRMMGSKIQIIGWSLYAMELWLLKFCIAVFYSRLTLRLKNYRLRVHIGYGLIAATYTATALSLLLGCRPFQGYWQVNPNPGAMCQPTNSNLNVLAVLIPNIVTDIYLMSIPLPLLWQVNISLRRKLSLMVLFGGAVFIIAAATIRAVVIITAGADGAVSGSEWACREIFVSTVITNLPIIQPLIRQMASKAGLSGLFSRSARTGSGKGYPLDSNGKDKTSSFGRMTKSKGTVLSQHHTTRTTAWASDENILPTGADGQPQPKNILVAQEISIVSESASDLKEESSIDSHGHWSSDHRPGRGV